MKNKLLIIVSTLLFIQPVHAVSLKERLKIKKSEKKIEGKDLAIAIGVPVGLTVLCIALYLMARNNTKNAKQIPYDQL